MPDPALMAASLDSIKDPVLFADTQHVIRYMNKAAIAHFDDGAALLDRSLLDCHNQNSRRKIIEISAAMQASEDERLINEDDKQRIYMRAVRDADGKLLGYYERYEPFAKPPPPDQQEQTGVSTG
ncbi:MAG TPA: PAS domain-containing protein [Phycisphaerae bacterium]|nr:PAS domain-containing protein [Phycisphaerae bacterium]